MMAWEIRRRRTWAPLLYAAALSLAGATPLLAAQPTLESQAAPDQRDDVPQPPAVRSRVRSDDAAVAALLREGHRRSATFRGLVEALDQTDGMIYVRPGRCPVRSMRGCVPHFMHRAGGTRYVFVVVDPDLDADATISIIGHELQHALEILQEPWILDSDDVFAHYRLRASGRMSVGSGRAFETSAAQHAGHAVGVELAETRTFAADADER